MKRLWSAVAPFLLPVAAGAQVIVGHVDVGNFPGFPTNGLPFTCGCGNLRYQQVYAASDFPGPLTINSLTFFRIAQQHVTFQPGTYDFWLSITSAKVGALSGNNLDANVTAPEQLFGSYVLSGPVPDSAFVFVGSNPFPYDPSLGNLLLDIRVTNGSATQQGLGAVNSLLPGPLTSRAFAGDAPGYGGAADSTGLVTGFNVGRSIPPDLFVVTTPEPSSLVLLGTGLVGLGAGVSRKKRRS